MNAAAVLFIQRLYPGLRAQLPPVDPPRTHAYTRIIREAEAGNYLLPSPESGDYLEYVLPFLALFSGSSDPPANAGAVLEKAERLNPGSVLAPYFLGLLHERRGNLPSAIAAYERARRISEDCYPAILALIRIRSLDSGKGAAIGELQNLLTRYPDNIAIKRFLAQLYYETGDWSRADSAIAEILQSDRGDRDFILMRARVLVELGQFPQAQAPLDLYASVNAQDPLYLFLRARVQAEGFRNRDAALNYLRAIIRSPPPRNPSAAQAAPVSGGNIVEEASVYAARLLMESTRAEDQREGRELLRRLTSAAAPSPAVLSLAVRDAIRREEWREARDNLTRLLAERRDSPDLLDAYTVEHGLGTNAAALAYARELYEKNRENEEAVAVYISALIDTGRQSEAARMIETRLETASGGTLKSRYYYLRSRVRNSEEQILNDLRSSLFEDPRNLSALMAMFEYYHRHRDERRAVYYLRQALTIAPDSPQLKRYEREYAALLRAN
jgi:tetratricopeptide (TPR) repeat protein